MVFGPSLNVLLVDITKKVVFFAFLCSIFKECESQGLTQNYSAQVNPAVVLKRQVFSKTSAI
jgi:hypothetical protein